jgi:hypothetical protein
MGIRAHFYGLESFNYESAKTCGKGMKGDKLKQGMLDIKDYFKTYGNGRYRGTIALIAGLPYETEESIVSNYNWLLDNWTDQSMMLNPLDIYKSSISNISLFEQNLEKYGYREMADTTGWELTKNMPRGPQFVKNIMIWENDYTNYYKIRKLVADLKKDTYCNFHRISYNLPGDLSNRGLDYTLSIKGDLPIDSEQREFTSQYITKKLNVL